MKEVIWEDGKSHLRFLSDGTAQIFTGPHLCPRSWVTQPEEYEVTRIAKAYADLYRQLHPVLPPLPSCPEDKEWERVEVTDMEQCQVDDRFLSQSGQWRIFGGSECLRFYIAGRGWVYRLRDKHAEWPPKERLWNAANSGNRELFDNEWATIEGRIDDEGRK